MACRIPRHHEGHSCRGAQERLSVVDAGGSDASEYRPNQIRKTFEHINEITGKREEFNPTQIFTSPSILCGGYENVYCEKTDVKGCKYQVAFQLRQETDTYKIGQATVLRAAEAGTTIYPLFKNSELEYHKDRKGVHKLYRLLIRKC